MVSSEQNEDYIIEEDFDCKTSETYILGEFSNFTAAIKRTPRPVY